MLLSKTTSMKGCIDDFLKSDTFSQYFCTRNWLVYNNISVVDVQVKKIHSTASLFSITVVLCGCCPFFSSVHMRNVCTQKFGNDCFVSLLKTHFPTINDVSIVHSNNNNLSRYVEELGWFILPSFEMNTVYPSYVLSEMFMTKHPMVDGRMKFLVFRGNRSNTSVAPLQNSLRHTVYVGLSMMNQK